MKKIKNEKEYIKKFEQVLNEKGIQKYPKLVSYFEQLKQEFLTTICTSNYESQWATVIDALSLDEKLVLLCEGIQYINPGQMSEEDIIEMVEEDYQTYNQENFGFKKNQFPHFSILFSNYFI